jgi:hypothetical protein
MMWPTEGAFLVEVATGRSRWPSSADPNRVLMLAERHGMIPRLARTVGSLDRIPGSLRAGVRAGASRIATLNLARTAELVRLTSLLGGVGVPTLALKGPALAKVLYGDVGARRFSDLDLLVPPGDVPAAAEALRRAGYAPEIPLEPALLDHLIRHDHECSFAGPEGPVELQWGALPGYFGVPWPVPEVIRRGTRVDLGGVTVPAPSTDDLCFYLLVHGAKHGWERLAWLMDLHTLAGLGVDWPMLAATSRALHVQRMVRIGPALAALVLGAGWAGDAQAAVGHDPTADRLAARVAERWFRDDEPAAHEPARTLDLDHLWMRERWRDRAGHLVRVLVTPTERDVPPSGGPPRVRSRAARMARRGLGFGRGVVENT